MAIHPDTLRRAAAELLAAEAARTGAFEADARHATRTARPRWAGVPARTLAGTAIAAFAVPPVGVAVALVGLVGAGAARLRTRRRVPNQHLSLHNHCLICRARWEQVAGPGADPAEVETIIHRYDPQHRVVADLVGEHPAVRAADRMAVQRRMAWVEAWRSEVGDSTPIADPAIRELLQRDRTELWLTEGTALGPRRRQHPRGGGTVRRPPRARPRSCTGACSACPRSQRVIVVLAPTPMHPTGVRIPGVGWVPAVAS